MKGFISRADLGNEISRNNSMILKKPDVRVNLCDFYSETTIHRCSTELAFSHTPMMESFLVKKTDELCLVCS